VASRISTPASRLPRSVAARTSLPLRLIRSRPLTTAPPWLSTARAEAPAKQDAAAAAHHPRRLATLGQPGREGARQARQEAQEEQCRRRRRHVCERAERGGWRGRGREQRASARQVCRERQLGRELVRVPSDSSRARVPRKPNADAASTIVLPLATSLRFSPGLDCCPT